MKYRAQDFAMLAAIFWLPSCHAEGAKAPPKRQLWMATETNMPGMWDVAFERVPSLLACRLRIASRRAHPVTIPVPGGDHASVTYRCTFTSEVQLDEHGSPIRSPGDR